MKGEVGRAERFIIGRLKEPSRYCFEDKTLYPNLHPYACPFAVSLFFSLLNAIKASIFAC